MKKRIVAWLLIMTMVLGLAGCGAASAGSTAGSEGGSTAQEGSAAKTITLYPYNAGLQSGPVTGWLGDYLLEKGIILEVIPYSEEKTQAMLASGSLPDIVVFNSATNAKAALEAGMLLPLDDYQDQLPHVMENDILKAGLDYAREYYGTEDGELSILPFGVGKNTLYAAADTDRYAIKLNYQLYEQIGAPEFEKLEDVIPILKEMQQAYPQNEEGMNVYAMNLFSDFDTTHFFNMMSIYSILGYHWNYLPYGIEYEIETGTPYSIFREDSVYRRGARFMYELNQQGLLDPDSLTQERATADKKVSSKASVAGWAGVPGWAGKGYLPVPFDEFKPSLVTEEPYGKVGIAISANAENVDTCLKFVDMLADYDALLTLYIINRINHYIEDHIEDYNLSLTELARMTGFNPSYLSRLYRMHTGRKLSEQIDAAKLRHAQELILSGTMVKNVAERTGFASPSAFILFFKRNTGKTPRQFFEERTTTPMSAASKEAEEEQK
jgi:AraC-like DNA-binding protein